MSSDEDEDELAVLRQQRKARLGAEGLTVSALRERQGTRNSSAHGARGELSPAEDEDDDDGPEVVEDVMLTGGLRDSFPMAFGEQEKPAEILEAVHAETVKKPAFGPPRPTRPPAAAGPRVDANGTATVGSMGPPPPRSVGPSRPELRPEVDDVEVGPPRPDAVPGGSDSEPDEDDGEIVGPVPEGREAGGVGLGEADEEDDPYNLPVTHEVKLEGHARVVTAMDVEHTGSRCITGSADYMVKMFDFNGMRADMRSFRQLEPAEGHPVNALSFSPSGDAFLAVTGSPQVRVYDRDGKLRGETLRGDMYIRDMKNTKGHVTSCTSGRWHPVDRYQAITGSEDGTVRVWDSFSVTQTTVIKPTLAKPGRVAVTTCCYNCDGTVVASGLMDGTIQLWDIKGKFGRSAAVGVVAAPKAQMVAKQDWNYVSGGRQLVRSAHAAGAEVTSLAFSRDGHTMVSRSSDATLKLWDVRKLGSPLHAFGGLPTGHATTSACFSPDEQLVLTGTDAGREGDAGAVVFFDRHRMEMVRRISMPGNVVALHWHERLNQIFVGCGDRKAGATHVLYHPSLSERGVLTCAGRKLRAKDPFDFQAPLVIITPHALPMFREEKRSRKREREKARMDPAKSQKPDAGAAAASGPGGGGRIGSTGGTLLTQYILKNHGLLKNPKEEDVRASILRHGDKAKEEMSAFTRAYATTQPKPIYDMEPEEEEEKDEDE